MSHKEIQTGYGVEGQFEDTRVSYKVAPALANIMKKHQDEYHMTVTVIPSNKAGQVTVTIEKRGNISIAKFEEVCSREYQSSVKKLND